MKIPDGLSVKKILVIEDELNIMKLCQKTLAGEGFEVDIAPNGKVAQGMLGEKRYDLCLVDIRTPEMNGIEFFRWLTGKHPEAADNIIFTTGELIGGEVSVFIEQSGVPFLPKPFTPGELLDIVRDTLGSKE